MHGGGKLSNVFSMKLPLLLSLLTPADCIGKETIQLPRLLYISTIVANFLVAGQCTPWELVQEVNCLAGADTPPFSWEDYTHLHHWGMEAVQAEQGQAGLDFTLEVSSASLQTNCQQAVSKKKAY